MQLKKKEKHFRFIPRISTRKIIVILHASWISISSYHHQIMLKENLC